MRRGACSVERQQYVMACIKGMENDSDAAPPSVFADMPTISLLEAVVTKDPRYTNVLAVPPPLILGFFTGRSIRVEKDLKE